MPSIFVKTNMRGRVAKRLPNGTPEEETPQWLQEARKLTGDHPVLGCRNDPETVRNAQEHCVAIEARRRYEAGESPAEIERGMLERERSARARKQQAIVDAANFDWNPQDARGIKGLISRVTSFLTGSSKSRLPVRISEREMLREMEYMYEEPTEEKEDDNSNTE